QSLLLEGGPTLAAAFLEADLVDKLLLFVAPLLGGVGPLALGPLPEPRRLTRFGARPVGYDILLSGYVHEPSDHPSVAPSRRPQRDGAVAVAPTAPRRGGAPPPRRGRRRLLP